MTEELKQKIDKIVRDYYTSPKALALYRNLKGLAYDVAEEATKELEKENAELRLKLEALDGQTPWRDIKDKSGVIGKLTNAKEIIKKLIALNRKEWIYSDVRAEAEQFLKKLEK